MTKYQKCVKDITTEEGWKSYKHKKQPLAVVIHFNQPIHTYSIKYNEMKEQIRLLITLDGKAKVEKELGIKIDE